MDVTDETFYARRPRALARAAGRRRLLGRLVRPVQGARAGARAARSRLAPARSTSRSVDVDANPQLAAHYGVSGIPAVKAFRNGQVVSEFTGVRSAQGVGDFLDGCSGRPPASGWLEELRESGEQPEVLRARGRRSRTRARAVARAGARRRPEQRDRDPRADGRRCSTSSARSTSSPRATASSSRRRCTSAA